jgi:hypothetical protein
MQARVQGRVELKDSLYILENKSKLVPREFEPWTPSNLKWALGLVLGLGLSLSPGVKVVPSSDLLRS